MFTYKVDCWVRPRSGFDLAEKNHFIQIIQDSLEEYENSLKESLQKLVKEFEKQNEGLVLKSLKLESDSVITDAYKELLPEIIKEYPEAKMVSWSMLPVMVEEESNYAE